MEFQTSPANRVFYYFQKICKIPHGSGNTKAISDFCVEFAKNKGLFYQQDDWNNVIIVRPAGKGYEDHEPVIFQGHLDMVCEKEPDVNIDFEKEGLRLYEENGYLKARGTTLGADDGIAIAYGLALLEKEDLCCPRLEVVFTADEETGMDGAAGIDLSLLQGRRLLNLDSEEEGIFLCGCAGGMRSHITFPVSRIKRRGILISLEISGLSGGHSGSEIDKEHGNAIVLLGRLLSEMAVSCNIGMESLDGGLKDNAIPRSAAAKILVASKDVSDVLTSIQRTEHTFRNEYAVPDPELHISASVSREETTAWIFDPSNQMRILQFLYTMPNGVQHMSTDIKGLVETSLNAGIMKTCKDRWELSFSVRSSVSSRKRLLADKLRTLTEALGGSCLEDGAYPAWEYKKQSPLREELCAVYEELFQKSPRVEVMHAGLECGLFMEKLPNLDCVSFGPQIDDIHTPKERLEIASAERIWTFLLTFLQK